MIDYRLRMYRKFPHKQMRRVVIYSEVIAQKAQQIARNMLDEDMAIAIL
jgi:hypothetical protein